MIQFFKRLWKDRRGNAILIAGAAMPVVVGAAGLATDTVQWVVWKRELQRAADSAAFAGVYAKAQQATVTTAVAADLTRNNKTGITILSGYPQIAYPTSVNWTDGVQVTVAIQKRLGFSSMFMSSAPIIVASGTAAMVPDGDYCVVALESGTATGITIGGNAVVNMGCGAISDSKSANAAVAGNGNYTFNATPVAAVGGLPSSITGATELQPHHFAMPDPYQNKYSTTVPSGMTCQNFQQHSYNVGVGQAAVKHLSPGCYTAFAPNGADTYYMDPGVYYLDSTSFTLNGNDTLIGSNVTIVLTGTSPGNVSMNGTATVQISAPNASNCGSFGSPAVNTCDYKNMLFIQSASAALNNGNTINGTSNSSFDGAMYFPKGQVSFTGTAASTTKCASIVANQVVFSGTTALQNSVSGCVSNTTVQAKTVRLVA